MIRSITSMSTILLIIIIINIPFNYIYILHMFKIFYLLLYILCETDVKKALQIYGNKRNDKKNCVLFIQNFYCRIVLHHISVAIANFISDHMLLME